MNSNYTIVLIDDNIISSFLTEKILTNELPNCKIITLGGSVEALDYLKDLTLNGNKVPDTFLIDINMPVLNGFELIEEIEKAKIDICNAKLYFYTSSEDPNDMEKAYSLPLPISGYIPKPLTKDKIESIFPEYKLK